MATALNRRFDVLCHSGVCPSHLIDVLSLLVAHANDTELFKAELRHGGGGEVGAVTTGAGSVRATSSTGPANCTDRAPGDARERQAADRRIQLMYKQAEDPEVLDDALRASHETVLIAAERSLQTYAEDLKHINDIAMATSAKHLRAMRVETQQQMEMFRDRVCGNVVERTKEELEVMRSELTASVRDDISDMVRQLHQVSLSTQQQLQELTSSYTDFVAQAHDVLTAAPLADVYETVKTVEYMQKQMDCMEATALSKSDVKALEERLKHLECTVATLGPVAEKSDGAATAASRDSVSTNVPLPLPLSQQKSLPSNGSVPHRSPRSKSTSPPPSHVHISQSASAKDQPLSTTAASRPPVQRTLAERLGVTVEAAEDGVVLVGVSPGSAAAAHRLGVGHIISHVGRTAVATPAAFEEALRASGGLVVKITTYDPFNGRVRVLTAQPF
ncbi:conserved hypothetical protein [Leishmania braziliensis MHOM/BR/75/M2904]|uniref:PDZ domain-containing protein n=2 Tax=Leishmania braziliensis TaxID=5660 RepID=A4HNP8_LEIBR|nr:conserved hypothetical protein [Leishmania braziliensis MHOM/BR/75/M2904]CAJ2481183.1 unnamed protein product [Leishmania braziliensis]CAJ2481449.1 unnamed protein product [Leishmania braziliensis]CAM43801.2 conserved hypothetical protein [Leishmania braziliensis MHOM/BR/75/M2904]SYZ69860.1 hypothetical_protein [Leishmania braziliensis MHOM/BR/75/M2904]